MSFKPSSLLLTAIVASLFVASLPAVIEAVPAVFVFGDSTADVGNNNFLPGDKSKANNPFYGVDFPNRVATGRFSNGYNGVDYLAMMMGFKMSPPPFLSIKHPKQIHQGVSFASGGSGILDSTGQNASLSMNTQIMDFQKVVEELTKIMGSERTAYFLSKSVFIFSTANNDLFAFFQSSQKAGGVSATQVDQFISALYTNFKDQLQRIYGLGARKFAVIGNTHIGCAPFIRVLTPNGDCIEQLNQLSQLNNQVTLKLLNELSSNLQGMKFSYTSVYNVLTNVLSTPRLYGFKEIKAACCGGGKLNAATSCNANATLCKNRREVLFWDGVHPTQATYRLVARHAFRGSRQFTTPINVQELVWS